MTPDELFKKLRDVDKDVRFRHWKMFKPIYGFDMCSGPAMGDYMLPDELPEETAEHFEGLMRRSVEDGHDYLLDYAKEHGKKYEYKFDPDKEY